MAVLHAKSKSFSNFFAQTIDSMAAIPASANREFKNKLRWPCYRVHCGGLAISNF